jgi:hypothetical protein
MSTAAVVGDENGLLKLVDINNDGAYTSYGEQSRASSLTGLCWQTQDESFWSTKADGSCELWRVADSALTCSASAQVDFSPAGIVRCVNESTGVVCYSSSGDIQIMKVKKSGGGISTKAAYHTNPTGHISEAAKGKYNVSDCRSCSDGIGFGGRENDLQLMDIVTGAVVWKARNMPNDFLSLRQPIFVNRLAFVNPETDSVSSGAMVVVGTGHKQVRLYDTRVSSTKRPIVNLEIGDYRVSGLTCERTGSGPADLKVCVGDTAGNMTVWDMSLGRRLWTLDGGNSAVRDMQFGPMEVADAAVEDGGRGAAGFDTDILCSIGLDRRLRVYNLPRRKLLRSVYLKSRPTRMLLFSKSCSGNVCFDAPMDSDAGGGSDDESEVYDGDEDRFSEYEDSDAEGSESESEDDLDRGLRGNESEEEARPAQTSGKKQRTR